ncbi:hypothetical protein PILCRDRAFT_15152 [Piloderma croceum F 1598]|uniref:Cytochrome b561 domain-containing protein n=1 Tax=Piloderma croceum (strain F 1598) TaxID=765440 RepID=A0A0C3AID2_PILCF|nr:hypothetical protein PILCRDRAFT_15152 [Piloderma croceum F 1598]
MEYNLHDRLAVAHAVFACIATLFTLPIALLVGRYRHTGAIWFKIHALFTGITIFLVVVVFVLGIGAVSSTHLGTQFSGIHSDLHHRVGLIVFVLFALQGILGIVAHKTPSGDLLRRVHVLTGIFAVAGLLGETWEGMHVEWADKSTSKTVTPQLVQLIFWVFVLVWATLYTVAFVQAVLLKNRGQEMHQMDKCADVKARVQSKPESERTLSGPSW